MIENRLKFSKVQSSEIGRTMVEMLAVLSLAGVLTFGAIEGFRYAMDKLNANDIIDGVNRRASIASSQRILGQSINLKEFHPNGDVDLIKETYEVEAWDLHGRNPDFFSLTVFDVSKGVCDRIMDSDYQVPTVIEVNGFAQFQDSKCEGSGDNLYDVTFVFDNTLGEREYQECKVDSECGANAICNQITATCMLMPKEKILDSDGNSHDCNSNLLIVPSTPSECDKCPNREMFSGYCAPVCQADEWLERRESAKQPQVVCRKCNAVTGWHYGTQNRAFCEVCSERYYFEDSWGGEHMCALRDCGEGLVAGNGGCEKCSDLKSFSLTTSNGDCCTPTGKESCMACNDPTVGPREVVGSVCRLKNCPAGHFRHNNDCISCSSDESYDVSNATNKANCLACVDDAGNKLRRLNGTSCILASKCLAGIQEDDPNTPGVDESLYCAECPADTFPVGNECKSCDDDMWYSVSKEVCNRCGDKRVIRSTLRDGSGIFRSNVCMRTKKEGEFYSSDGTKPCTYPNTVVNTGDECLESCAGTRIVIGDERYYCRLPCAKGQALGGTECYDCDTTISFDGITFVNGENQSFCSASCPGQRYLHKGICSKCPAGTYSIGSNATSCDGVCPADRSGLEEGACIACGSTWNGTSCGGGGCSSDEYNKNGICTTCPADLSEFTGSVNERYCSECNGIWNANVYKCCPRSDFSVLKTKSDCEGCFGQWANNTCTKCPTGQWGQDGVCNHCPAYVDISSELSCRICGGTWNNGAGTCQSP